MYSRFIAIIHVLFPFAIFKEVKQAIDLHLKVENKTFQEYIQAMKRSGEYGDHLMLYAAACYTKFRIEIVSAAPGLKNYAIMPQDMTAGVTTTIAIGHIADYHFVVLE